MRRRLLALSAVLTSVAGLLIAASPAVAATPVSLWTGQTLASGQSLLSPNGWFRLVMQDDGNLVLREDQSLSPAVLFASGTWGNPGATATLQADGNFVVYDPAGRALWWSGVRSTLPSRLDVQDDASVDQYLADGTSPWAAGQTRFPVSADHSLHAGQVMTPAGQAITSPSGRFALDIGDLALVASENESAPGVRAFWEVWQPVSARNDQTLAFTLQTDGNLVLYRNGATPSWSSGTAGSGADRFDVQDDGNLVLYAGGRAVWATGTTPRVLVTTQSLPSGTRWVQHVVAEAGPTGGTMMMQGDGNLVVYGENGAATWASGTSGHPGAHLTLQADGNLVIYDAGGVARWSSGTAGCGRNTVFAFEDALEGGEGLVLRHGATEVWDGRGRRASC